MYIVVGINAGKRKKVGLGLRCRKAAIAGCDLAFFSVVASSPNLSTFIYATKIQKLF